MVYIIVKGERGGHIDHSKPKENLAYEQAVERRLENGSVTDSDLMFLEKTDDRRLKAKYDRIHNERYKAKKYLDNKYGKDVFDGIDKDGNYYKDIPLDVHNR